MRNINKIKVHPIFAECTNITDPCWLKYLENASYNKFNKIKGITFADGVLKYQKTKNIKSLQLSADPNEAALEFIKFLQDEVGIFSEREKQEMSDRNTDIIDHGNWEWKKQSKEFQKILLCNYVDKMIERYTLSNEEASQLQKLLDYDIQDKNITNYIIIENRTITDIPIVWNEEDRRFYIHEAYMTPSKVSSSDKKIIKKKPIYIAKWEETLKSITI